MGGEYALGVALAVGSGILFQVGALLQKKAVNEVAPEAKNKGFIRNLAKRPIWLLGILFQFGLGAAAFVMAIKIIGPALVPGLTAAGFIVLAIGSVRLLGESLNTMEYIGMAVMGGGVCFLGVSGLDIAVETVVVLLKQPGVQLRIALFTVVFSLVWGGLFIAALKSRARKGVIMALSAGVPYGIMNFWVSLLIASILTTVGGRATMVEWTVIVVAVVVLVLTNVLGIWQMQVVFKYAQAGNSVPVNQIPVQVAPIFVYFAVFALRPENWISALYLAIGVSLIIAGGFLLGRRQTVLETTKQ